VTRRITDTLESFTIAQAAQLWAKESGEQADLIERRLVSAAYQATSDPYSEDVGYRVCLEPLNAKYDGLSTTQRAQAIHAFEKKLYSKIDGLCVDHRNKPVTGSTTVRRMALEVWCAREGFEPQFLNQTPEDREKEVRVWLWDQIRAVEQQPSLQKAKAAYRASAIKEFGSSLSKRAFDRLWDNIVPDAWKRGGRPKKP
jgi:hypothetical protein